MHTEHIYPRDQGKDTIELGMRVEFRVLCHRQTALMRDGRKGDRARQFRGRMFHDDNHRRARPAERWMLERQYLNAARNHQPTVDVCVH